MSNNQSDINFAQFQQLYRTKKYALIQMLSKEGSSSFKKKRLYKQCVKLAEQRIINAVLSSIVTPAVLIFLGTIALHTKRSFALTSGTVLRRFTLKYLPVISFYSLYQQASLPSPNISHLQKDYADIQYQFSAVYEKHSQVYLVKKGYWQKICQMIN